MPAPVWVECEEAGAGGGGLIFGGVILPQDVGTTYTDCSTILAIYTEKFIAAATYTEPNVTAPAWTEGVE